MINRISMYLLCLLLISCVKQKTDYYSFPKNTWNTNDLVRFKINIEDTNITNSLFFCIRHTTSYSYQNLIFFTHHYYNNKKISTDTFDIDLANDDGKWYGIGKTDIRELTNINYKSNKFYNKGFHTFELELAMRDYNNLKIDSLCHISDISLFSLVNDE